MIDTDALARYFGFLETEFGAKRVKLKLDRWDRQWLPSVLYVNATTAVHIRYEVRDAYADVRLYPLEDGDVPANARDGLHGIPLNHLVALENKADLLGSAYDHPEFEDAERGLELYLERVVHNLRRYGGAFLSGDFSLLPRVLPTLSKRAGAED